VIFGKLKTTVCFFSVFIYRRINFIMIICWFNMKYVIASNIEIVGSCSKWPIFWVNGFWSMQIIVNNFIQCALICSWEEAIYFKWSVLRIYYNHYFFWGLICAHVNSLSWEKWPITTQPKRTAITKHKGLSLFFFFFTFTTDITYKVTIRPFFFCVRFMFLKCFRAGVGKALGKCCHYYHSKNCKSVSNIRTSVIRTTAGEMKLPFTFQLLVTILDITKPVKALTGVHNRILWIF